VNRLMKNLAVYVLMVLMVVAAVYGFQPSQKNPDPFEGDYNSFIQALENDQVKSVRIIQNTDVRTITGELVSGDVFELTGPPDDQNLTNAVKEKQIPYYQDPTPKTPWWLTLLGSFLPILLVLALMFFMLQQTQGGGGKVMQFGKSRAKLQTDDKKKVTFADVAGVDEVKEELQEVVDFLKSPDKFTAIGAKIPKGVLLFGSPGTGKTLLARAVAGEAGVPFFSISGSDFVEMFVGVGASRVRDLFEQAKKNSPCIVFIDEIDAVGRQRGAGLGGGHDEREQTLNQLLVEMDGFTVNESIIIIAATNRPDILDPALLRPGRFDRQIVVDAPDIKGRKEILMVHAKGKPLDDDVVLDVLARRTPGFTGADLANLMNEAALLAARRNKKKITMLEMEDAIERVIAGPEKKNRTMNAYEQRLVAYHESGHTLVAGLLMHTDPIHKVSIIPRGRAGGYTLMLPEEDRKYIPRNKLLDDVKTLLGGRIAEALVLEEISTGATNDLERASKLIRKMITEYGMSEALGPLTYGTKQEQVFLGRDYSQGRDYSEAVAEDIDKEARHIMNECYHEAETILKENIEVLHTLAKNLMKKETLDASEVQAIFEQAGLKKPEAPWGKLEKLWTEEDEIEAAKNKEQSDKEAANQTVEVQGEEANDQNQ
jgi:cell division protease FtsH